MVRQWIANSLPPVRIWVPPYKLLLKVLTLNVDKIIINSVQGNLLLGNVVKLVDTMDLKSIA